MELATRLHEDMKAALKGGQKDRLGVIRMMLSDVKNIDLMPGKPTAEAVVEAYGKRLRKSREEYQKLGKQAEVDALTFEIGVVEEYLPKRASAEETERLVDAFLAGGAYTEKQVGQATGAFLKAHGKEVDPALVNPLIRKKLAGKWAGKPSWRDRKNSRLRWTRRTARQGLTPLARCKSESGSRSPLQQWGHIISARRKSTP